MRGLVAVDLKRPFCMGYLILLQDSGSNYKAATIIGRYSAVRVLAIAHGHAFLHDFSRTLKAANVGLHRETVASRW